MEQMISTNKASLPYKAITIVLYLLSRLYSVRNFLLPHQPLFIL